MDKLLFTRIEAARIISQSVRQLDYFISTGVIATRKVGKKRLIPRVALEEFARRDHPSPKQSQETISDSLHVSE
jgi:hypothetical protein